MASHFLYTYLPISIRTLPSTTYIGAASLTDSSRGFSQNFYEIFAKYLRNFYEIFAQFLRNFYEIFAKFAKLSQNFRKNFAKNHITWFFAKFL